MYNIETLLKSSPSFPPSLPPDLCSLLFLLLFLRLLLFPPFSVPRLPE